MNQKNSLRGYTRPMAVVAVMSALSIVLMMLEFSVPVVPSFLKFDISDFPALLTSFAVSPLAGVAVCFLKNVLHLFFTATSGVGELANFIISSAFVFPAGLLYKRFHTKFGAVLASFVGAVAAALMCVPVNYFITYPFYAKVMIPMDAIIGMYQAILPSVDGLLEALLVFNLPFTFVKGSICILLTFLVYKPLSPILKGKVRK
ncbi:MAG: ECF transporter S component [Ruminococcaceae bacterium]|nr:ECF transporter S component [Oscillospiraceae bacterium]